MEQTEELEYHLKYRPKTFKEMVGQDKAVRQLRKMVKAKAVPHVVAFTGPAGCGKTTAARILADHVGGSAGLSELNASDYRGIDAARRVKQHVDTPPLVGDARVWIIDEAHGLTSQAQNCLLKPLEEPRSTSYVFLCSSEFDRLIKAIKSRCTKVDFGLIEDELIAERLAHVVSEEKLPPKVFTKDVLSKVAEESFGSLRNALVQLYQIRTSESEKEAMAGVTNTGTKKYAIDLCRTIILQRKPNWKTVANLLKQLESDPEEVRRAVMGYAAKVILDKQGFDAAKCNFILLAFSDPLFDPGTARARLIQMAYDAVHMK